MNTKQYVVASNIGNWDTDVCGVVATVQSFDEFITVVEYHAKASNILTNTHSSYEVVGSVSADQHLKEREFDLLVDGTTTAGIIFPDHETADTAFYFLVELTSF